MNRIRSRWVAAGFLALLLLAFFLPSCGVKYVLVAGYYQAELLASARSVDKVLESGTLSAGQEQRLRLIGEVKEFGRTVGLSATDNYETVALDWRRTVWNVSACDPLRFEPESWWFPIVGRIHYLGFFTSAEAQSWRVKMETRGLDVYVREAGAFSTLGWFKDPILPNMLRWDEAQLSETILHELTHATLWIPGSAMFNETFADVVGSEAGDRWLVQRYGAEHPSIAEKQVGDEDFEAFRALLRALYQDLDAMYQDAALDEAVRRARKAELYASMDERVLASGIQRKPRYLQVVRTSEWNNARLVQYRTYNEHEDWFRTILAREGGDLPAFIEAIRTITKGARDPYVALGEAVGVKNP